MSSPVFLTDSAADVFIAARTLADGGLLGLPTETVYGLAADALNPQAVASIFKAKGRPSDHPLIVHVFSVAQVSMYAADLPAFAQALMKAFWPGPLTLILPRRAGVAEACAGGHETIALRCPSHPLARQVLQQALSLGVTGVAAPSANLFGRVSPTTAMHVREAFADLPVLDGGACEVGIESTIVDASRGVPVLMRPGMLSAAQLSAACGQPVQRLQTSHTPSLAKTQAPAAPGMLLSHYAPRAKLCLGTAADIETQAAFANASIAVWVRSNLQLPAHVKQIDMPGNATAAAHELFATLRELDALGVAQIWVETPPAGDDWEGVRDRLQRASA
jgi:L-threonylcarbamoyladenylate synthase